MRRRELAFKYLPLECPPRRHLELGLDLEKVTPKMHLRFFATLFYHCCVISISRYCENELAATVLFFFLFLNIASAIYRTWDKVEMDMWETNIISNNHIIKTN